jgi:hypothetical protein
MDMCCTIWCVRQRKDGFEQSQILVVAGDQKTKAQANLRQTMNRMAQQEKLRQQVSIAS